MGKGERALELPVGQRATKQERASAVDILKTRANGARHGGAREGARRTDRNQSAKEGRDARQQVNQGEWQKVLCTRLF